MAAGFGCEKGENANDGGGGHAGAAASSGAGGVTSGSGGELSGAGSGDGGYGGGGSVQEPTTCAEGVPKGPTSGAGGCSQGTFSVGSVLSASGFDDFEGKPVHAAFTRSQQTRTATTSVQAGRFDLDFLFASYSCNLGAGSRASAALYIDVDANGSCNPEVDSLYLWGALGGPAGTCRTLELTPESPRCASDYGDAVGPDRELLAAAQAACPAVGDCLQACGTAPNDAGGASAACPTDNSAGEGGVGGSAD